MDLFGAREIVAECPISARPYQTQAADCVYAQWQSGVRSTLVQMATGLSKTITGALIARRFPDHRGRVLVVVNREELIKQWVKWMQRVCNNDDVEIEQGERRANRNRYSLAQKYGKKRAHARIVVASKDTMWRDRRLRTFDRDEFGLIIVDECALWMDDNPTWHNIIEHFPGAQVVGFDAFPERSDGKKMNRVFDSVACEYPISDAVADGWLVPPVQQYCVIGGFDLSRLKKNGKKDWSSHEIDIMMRQESYGKTPAQGIACETVRWAVDEGAKKRPGHILSTLIFMPRVDSARLVADILNRRHAADGTGRAAIVSAEDTDSFERRAILEAFEDGEIKYLCNCNVATRGYDNPGIEMVVMGRPTKFLGLAAQMIGRGTRPSAEIADRLGDCSSVAERKAMIAVSSKPQCLILDPVGVSEENALAVDMIDILNHQFTADEELRLTARRVTKTAAMTGTGRVTIGDVEMMRGVAEAEMLRARREFIVDAETTYRQVDPFNTHDGIGGAQNKKKGRPENATPAQIAFLVEKSKLDRRECEKMSFGEAGALMADQKRRWKGKLCSIKQSRLLISKGVKAATANNMLRTEAKALIDSIAANGWKLPDSFEG